MATQAAARPNERIVIPHDPGDGIIRIAIVEGVLTAQQGLRDATAALEIAIKTLASATAAETTARHEYDYAELDFRAKRLAESVPGKNETERKINLDLAVMDDEELSDLRSALDGARDCRARQEALHRCADIRHKAARVELAALGQLVGAV